MKKPAPKINSRIAMMNAAKAAKRAQREAEVERRQPPVVRRPGTDPLDKALNAVERAAARRQAELGPSYGKMEPYDDGVDDDPTPIRGAPRQPTPAQEVPGGLGSAKSKAARSTVGRTYMVGDEARRELQPKRPLQYGPNGRVMVMGRDGKMLTRTSVGTSDKFHIPAEIIPDGWSYQFIACSVYGKRESTIGFMNNGWAPVMANRHDGMFMPIGHDGPIIVDELMLVERPIELTLEAREEEIGAARNLIRTQNEQFTPRLPGARRHPETQLRARRTIEVLPPDVPSPQYRYGVDDGV